MMNFDQKKLDELARKHNLKLLILHGSYAKGTATKISDVDVGILGNKAFNRDNYFDILNDFSDIFGEKFDPAFLNNTEPMICYQVSLSGKPLYEDSKGDFMNFKLQSIGRYMDTKKFRDLEKNYVKRAAGLPAGQAGRG